MWQYTWYTIQTAQSAKRFEKSDNLGLPKVANKLCLDYMYDEVHCSVCNKKS